MKIKTNVSLISDREKITQRITEFWDRLSESWQIIWGPHIHHGYYENNQSLKPKEAQEKLIEKLVDLLRVNPRDKILDVGCGMGGSSIFLAKNYNAHVTGITLSQKQIEIAKYKAQESSITKIDFKIADALELKNIQDNSFDIVWSLESCEQFFNKEIFIAQAYRVLKPGGKLMLATWCSSQEEYEGKLAKQYQKLCREFDVPYMPTIECYNNFLHTQNFQVLASLDWSNQVKKSWDIGLSLINAYTFWQLLKMGAWRGYHFAKQIRLMRNAFYEERVRYGVFLAIK